MLASPTGRKAEHLRIAAGPGTQHDAGSGLERVRLRHRALPGSGLERVRLRHRALPGRDLEDVDLTTDLLGARLAAPLVVSAMTGGTPGAEIVNRRLADAAAEHGIALVLGSGRPLLGDPDLLSTPRSAARPPLLLANLGVVQLSAPDAARRLVELLGADGLSIHLNPIQEAVQPEGPPCFGGAIERIAETVAQLHPLPVVVKWVGFGMDGADIAALRDTGVAAVDVAGSGGTNWVLVEGLRDPTAGTVAQAFADWGVPTAEALIEARALAPQLPLIASGGVRDGVDVARCLALGASAAGLARPLLIAAQQDRAGEFVGVLVRQLRIATWAAGAARCADLGAGEHLR